MINGKRVIGWIPARAGSKGIKDKNIKLLDGKPLIAHTIEAAKKSQYIDAVMVSTDSEKIAKVAVQYGAWVPELRPKALAGDTSKTLDAVIYSLKYFEKIGEDFDIFCLLQPTSPLRTNIDIDEALRLYEKNRGMYDIVSVAPVRKHPLFLRSIGKDGRMEKLLPYQSTVRRQDMPPYFEVNGAIYINAVDRINGDTSFNDNTVPFIMSSENSVDIDEAEDFVLAEYFIKNK